MGVLYARVSGAWVPVQGVGAQGPSGGPVPVGGAVGDLIIKSGAPDFAVRWGYDPPKVYIPSTYTPALASTPAMGDPLTIGVISEYNVVGYRTGFMARNNGAAAVLRLNYYGGSVNIGGGSSAQFPLQLTLEEGPSTSKRAYMKFGTGWEIGQDWNGNGTRDLYVWNSGSGLGLKIDASTQVFSFGHGTGQVDLNLDGSTGANGATTPRLSSSAGWVNLHAKTDAYIDGDVIYFRSAAYGVKGTWDNTNFIAKGHIYADGAIYQGNGEWFRVRGGTGIYWQDYGGGWYMADATYMRAYNGKTIYTSGGLLIDGTSTLPTIVCNGSMNMGLGNYIRLAGSGDNNHRLNYTSATPSGSGEACNGPQLVGYGTVLLNTVTGSQFFLASGGSVFINAGKDYNKFSSREFKDNITVLDPDECLDQVTRWRPVEFDLIADGTHAEGFIAEDHVAVTPSMVNVCGPDSLRPGWANAIAYEMATPRLAGAIQALVARIEQLERKAA